MLGTYIEKAGEQHAGVFIRLPDALAGDFPTKAEDDSPPHITVVYLGKDTSTEQLKKLIQAVTDVSSQIEPFELETKGLDHFENADKQSIANVRFESEELTNLHFMLRGAALSIDDSLSFHDGYKGHATLAYLEQGEKFTGKVPQGKFKVDSIGFWSALGKQEIPLMGKTDITKASPDHNSKLLELLDPFLKFLPFGERRKLRSKAAGFAGGKATQRKRRALKAELYSTDEIAKADAAEIQKQLNPDSIALLIEADDPLLWTEAIKSALGDRGVELVQIFKAMRFEERRFIRVRANQLVSNKSTFKQFNKAADEFRTKFNIEQPKPADNIKKQSPPANAAGHTAGETLAKTKTDGKFSQADANYVAGAPSPKAVCGNCRFFLRKEGSEVGSCEVVDGAINWFGTSDLWIGATEEAAYVYETTAKNYTVEILKQDEEQRLVTGIVLEPETVDSQGDVIDEDEIRKAMEFFMQHQVLAVQHEKNADGSPIQRDITVIESHQAVKGEVINGTEVKKGAWIMTVKVWAGDVWADVKSGVRTGFSIRGPGYRQPVAA